MKINELRQVIRQVVKEEVNKAVAEEVSRAMGKVLVEMVREIKSPTLHKNQEILEEEEEPRVQGAILKTKNPKLNSVLAETAHNFKPLKKVVGRGSLAELLGGGFDKIGDEDAGVMTSTPVNDGTKIGFLKSIVSESVGTPSVLDRGADVPDILKGVFKKDFRAVLRKMDEQKKTGGQGMINRSQILSG